MEKSQDDNAASASGGDDKGKKKSEKTKVVGERKRVDVLMPRMGDQELMKSLASLRAITISGTARSLSVNGAVAKAVFSPGIKGAGAACRRFQRPLRLGCGCSSFLSTGAGSSYHIARHDLQRTRPRPLSSPPGSGPFALHVCQEDAYRAVRREDGDVFFGELQPLLLYTDLELRQKRDHRSGVEHHP